MAVINDMAEQRKPRRYDPWDYADNTSVQVASPQQPTYTNPRGQQIAAPGQPLVPESAYRFATTPEERDAITKAYQAPLQTQSPLVGKQWQTTYNGVSSGYGESPANDLAIQAETRRLETAPWSQVMTGQNAPQPSYETVAAAARSIDFPVPPRPAQTYIQQAAQQRMQATNARFQAAGQPLPYPQAGVPGQAMPGQAMQAQPGGVAQVAGYQGPNLAQREMPFDLWDQHNDLQTKQIVADNNKESAKELLRGYGDFSYLGLDADTTQQLKELQSNGIAKGGFAVTAASNIREIIKQGRAAVKNELARKQKLKDEQAKVEAANTRADTLQAKKDADAKAEKVYGLRLKQSESYVSDQRAAVDKLQAKIDKIDPRNPANDATLERLDGQLAIEQARLDAAIAKRNAMYEEGITGVQPGSSTGTSEGFGGLPQEAPAGTTTVSGFDGLRSAAPVSTPAPAAGTQAPAQVKDEADRSNLPVGTIYIGPDGKKRKKT